MKKLSRKAKMAIVGVRQKDIAVRAGVSEAAVSRVANGHIRSRKIEKMIDDIYRKESRRFHG